jgi:hypothetical protein
VEHHFCAIEAGEKGIVIQNVGSLELEVGVLGNVPDVQVLSRIVVVKGIDTNDVVALVKKPPYEMAANEPRSSSHHTPNGLTRGIIMKDVLFICDCHLRYSAPVPDISTHKLLIPQFR